MDTTQDYNYFIFLFQLSIVFAAVFCIIVLRIVLIQVMHDTTNAAENIDFFAKYAKLIGVGLAARWFSVTRFDYNGA